MLVGKTPVLYVFSNKKRIVIEMKLDGYKDASEVVGTHVSGGWVVADLLLAGLIGIVVDAITGEWFEPNTTHVHIDLRKEEAD